MSQFPALRRSAIAGVLVALLGASGLYAQKTVVRGPSILGALPSDSCLVIQIPSISGLSAKLKASPLGEIGTLAEVKAAMKDLETALEKPRAEAKRELGFDPFDVLMSAEGEVVVTVGSIKALQKAITEQLSGLEPTVTSEDVSALVYVDAGGAKAKFEEAFSTLFAKGREQGVNVESSDFHGGTITKISPPKEAGEQELKSVHFGQLGSRFFLSLSPKSLQEVMANVAGGKSGGLVEESRFQTTHSLAGVGGDLFFFLNVRAITETVGGALNATFYGFFWQKFQSLVLGKSLNNLGMAIQVSPSQGISQKMFVHNGGAADGMLGWFKTPPLSTELPAYIPQGVHMLMAVGVDFSKILGALQEIGGVALSFQGGGNFEAMFEQQTGVKFADLKRSLGKRLDLFSTRLATQSDPVGDMTLLLGLDSPKPLRDLLARATQLAPGSVVPSNYQGYEVLSFPDAGLPIALSITDKSLVFGMEKESVQKVLVRLKQSAGEAQTEQRVKDALKRSPGQVNLYQYQRTIDESQAETFANDLISQITMAVAATGEPSLPPSVTAAIKAGLKGLAGAFEDGVGWGLWKEQGFYLESISPFAKKAKATSTTPK